MLDVGFFSLMIILQLQEDFYPDQRHLMFCIANEENQ